MQHEKEKKRHQLDHTALAFVYSNLQSYEINAALGCCRDWSLSPTMISALRRLRSTERHHRLDTEKVVSLLTNKIQRRRIATKERRGEIPRTEMRTQMQQSFTSPTIDIAVWPTISAAAYDTDIQTVAGPFAGCEGEPLPWRQFQYDESIHSHCIINLHTTESHESTASVPADAEGAPVILRGLTHRVWDHHLTMTSKLKEYQYGSSDKIQFTRIFRWLAGVISPSSPAKTKQQRLIVLTIVDAQPHVGALNFALTSRTELQTMLSVSIGADTVSLHSFISSTQHTNWTIAFFRYLVWLRSRPSSSRACYVALYQRSHNDIDSSFHLREDHHARSIFTQLLQSVSDSLKITSLYVNIISGVSAERWLNIGSSMVVFRPDHLYLINCIGSFPLPHQQFRQLHTIVIVGHPQYGCYIDTDPDFPLLLKWRQQVAKTLPGMGKSIHILDCLLDSVNSPNPIDKTPINMKRCQFADDDGSHIVGETLSNHITADSVSHALMPITHSTLLPLFYRELRLRFLLQVARFSVIPSWCLKEVGSVIIIAAGEALFTFILTSLFPPQLSTIHACVFNVAHHWLSRIIVSRAFQ